MFYFFFKNRPMFIFLINRMVPLQPEISIKKPQQNPTKGLSRPLKDINLDS